MQENEKAKRYMAFISYSHADNREEGRKWADWLHTSLETYEIPEELIGEKNSRDEEIPRQIYPVFQDEKELSASASLSDSLKDSLDRTENLILLCSPKSAKSIYVQDEVKYFKQIGRSKNIIALILSGEPQPEGQETDIQCFPKVLRYAVDSNGEVLLNQPEEPIAADVRTENAGEGFTTPEAYRRSLLNKNLSKVEIQSRVNAYKDKLDNARLKVISGILKVPLGELTKRDKAYELKKMKTRNRNIKRIATAISVLGILAIIAGILAWRQKNKAEDTLARSLYQTGVNRIESEDISNGAAYIAAAARMGNENAVMFAQSLLTNQNTEVKLPNIQYAGGLQYSPDGKYFAYIADNGVTKEMVSVWDAIKTAPIRTLANNKFSKFTKPQFDDSGTKVYGLLENGNIISWDFLKDKTEMITNFDSLSTPLNFLVSPDGKMAYLGFADKTYAFYNIATKNFASGRLPVIERSQNFNKIVFSKAGNYAVEFSNNSDAVRLSTIDSGTIVNTKTLQLDTAVTSVKFNNAGTQLALYNLTNAFIINLAGPHVPVKLNTRNTFQDLFFNPDGSVATRGTYEYTVFSGANGQLLKAFAGNRFLDNIFREEAHVSPDKTQMIKSPEGNVLVQNIFSTPMLQSQLLLDSNFVKAVITPGNENVYILNRGTKEIEKRNLGSGEQKSPVFKMQNNIYSIRQVTRPKIVYTISKVDSGSKLMTVAFWDEQSEKPIGKPVILKTQSYNLMVTEDGKKFAAREDDHTIAVFNVGSASITRKFRSVKPVKNYLVSPKLNYAIVVAPDKSWQVVNVENNKILKTEKGSAEGIMAASFSNDEKYTAIRMADGTVNVWNIPDMSLRFKFSSQSTNDGVLKFSPDSKTLAASEDVHNIALWNVEDKTVFGQRIKTEESIRNFDWSPDGKRIFMVLNNNDKGNIYVFDAVNGYPATQPFGTGGVFDSQISEDGNGVMTVSSTSGNMLLNFWEMPGSIHISNSQLADDLEQLFGKKYNEVTGAIETAPKVKIDSTRWYFQDPYVRKSTPGAQLTALEMIKTHVPVKSEADINFLTATARHPLTRAGVAAYYARDPQTRFIADYLIQLIKYQLPRITNSPLKQEVEQTIARAGN